MKDCLSRIAAIIDDHAVTARIEPPFFSKRLRDIEKMPDTLSVFLRNTVNIPNVLFRYNQDMSRCLWINILEGDGLLIFEDNLCRNVLFDDLAENAIGIAIHFEYPYSFAKLLKKQLLSPVWHAGPVCSTLTSNVSWSQSYRMSFTFWT